MIEENWAFENLNDSTIEPNDRMADFVCKGSIINRQFAKGSFKIFSKKRKNK